MSNSVADSSGDEDERDDDSDSSSDDDDSSDADDADNTMCHKMAMEQGEQGQPDEQPSAIDAAALLQTIYQQALLAEGAKKRQRMHLEAEAQRKNPANKEFRLPLLPRQSQPVPRSTPRRSRGTAYPASNFVAQQSMHSTPFDETAGPATVQNYPLTPRAPFSRTPRFEVL